MYSVSKKSFSVILLAIFLSKVALTEWVSLQSGTVNIPAHVYQVSLNSGEVLTGSLTWNETTTINTTTNLDIYIYRSGDNILLDLPFSKFNQTDPSSQNFTFTAPSSSTFYVRIIPQQVQFVFFPYNIKLTTASSIIVDQSGYYHYYNAFMIRRNLTFKGIAVKYETNSSDANSAMVLYAGNLILLQSNKLWKMCNINIMSDPGYLIFIIVDTLTSATALTPISYNLSYYIDYPSCFCKSNQIWNPIIQKCWLKTTDTVPVGVIVGAVVGAVLGIALIVIGVFLWRRYKKTQAEKKFHENKGQFNDTHNNIKQNDSRQEIKVEQSCPICLGPKSNHVLECKHAFHKQCIEEWLKKNNVCPLCKMGFSTKK